jgi:hypothetical protein
MTCAKTIVGAIATNAISDLIFMANPFTKSFTSNTNPTKALAINLLNGVHI